MPRRRRRAFRSGRSWPRTRRRIQLGKTDFTDDAAIAEWADIPVQHRRGLAGQHETHLGKGYCHGRPAACRRRPAFRTSAPATATTCTPSSRATTSRSAASTIPHGKKLSGHSDADVGLHALTDALLATCGAGDIGTHFPPSDPQWKGAASRIFVEHAAAIVRARGGRIANADITLICEAPRIGPHREAMAAAIVGDARHFRRPHLDQGDHQREARLHRPRGRHRGDRHGQRRLSRRGCPNERTGRPRGPLPEGLRSAARSCWRRRNPAPAA